MSLNKKKRIRFLRDSKQHFHIVNQTMLLIYIEKKRLHLINHKEYIPKLTLTNKLSFHQVYSLNVLKKKLLLIKNKKQPLTALYNF